MAVSIKQNGQAKNIAIEVTEKDGEVLLKYNDHAFVRVRTTDGGDHMVDVVDANTGVLHSDKVIMLCWSR
jgi:hypothetical protein